MEDLNIPVTLLITLAGLLVGAGIGWGTVKVTVGSVVKRFEQSVAKLETVTTQVAVIETTQKAHAQVINQLEERVRATEIELAMVKAQIAH